MKLQYLSPALGAPVRKHAGGPASIRSGPSRGNPSPRCRLAVFGMLLAVLSTLAAMLGTTALSAAAAGQPRAAASLVSGHSVEADRDSGAGRFRCTQRAHRMGGPDDHKVKTSQDHERATSRRIVDHHPEAPQPAGCEIVPPEEIVLDDPRAAEDHYEYQAYRTFDGRAPPRYLS